MWRRARRAGAERALAPVRRERVQRGVQRGIQRRVVGRGGIRRTPALPRRLVRCAGPVRAHVALPGHGLASAPSAAPGSAGTTTFWAQKVSQHPHWPCVRAPRHPTPMQSHQAPLQPCPARRPGRAPARGTRCGRWGAPGAAARACTCGRPRTAGTGAAACGRAGAGTGCRGSRGAARSTRLRRSRRTRRPPVGPAASGKACMHRPGAAGRRHRAEAGREEGGRPMQGREPGQSSPPPAGAAHPRPRRPSTG